MQYRICFTAMFLTALTQVAVAQGPVGDQVTVTFDRPVQVGSHTLAAGEYTIRQVTSASNPRVLEFTSNHGTKLDATVTAIPILQNTPPSETKIILDEGVTPRLTRIWVQGKSYGYEFPGESVPAPQVSAMRLEGQFSAAPTAPVASAQVRVAEPPAPPVAIAPPEPPAPAAAPEPAVIAQNRTPEPPAQVEPPAPPQDNAAAAQPDIPATALGWVPLAFAGLTIAMAGLILYRRDQKTSNVL